MPFKDLLKQLGMLSASVLSIFTNCCHINSIYLSLKCLPSSRFCIIKSWAACEGKQQLTKTTPPPSSQPGCQKQRSCRTIFTSSTGNVYRFFNGLRIQTMRHQLLIFFLDSFLNFVKIQLLVLELVQQQRSNLDKHTMLVMHQALNSAREFQNLAAVFLKNPRDLPPSSSSHLWNIKYILDQNMEHFRQCKNLERNCTCIPMHRQQNVATE